MAFGFVTPVYASSADDLVERWRVVNRVARRHPLSRLGFAVYFGTATLRDFGLLRRNLEPYLNVPLTVHAPYDNRNPKRTSPMEAEGLKALRRVCDFAHEIGAEVVDVHANVVRERGSLLPPGYTRGLRMRWLERTTESFNKLNDATGVRVALENEPFPGTTLGGDLILSVVGASMECLRFLVGRGVGICFDTAHYAITRATAERFHQRRAKTYRDILGSGLAGYFPEDLKGMPLLADAMAELAPGIVDMHLNDAVYRGDVREARIFTEAVPVGVEESGLVKFDDLKLLFERKRHQTGLFVINAEVSEENYSKPVNAERCLNDLCSRFKH